MFILRIFNSPKQYIKGEDLTKQNENIFQQAPGEHSIDIYFPVKIHKKRHHKAIQSGDQEAEEKSKIDEETEFIADEDDKRAYINPNVTCPIDTPVSILTESRGSVISPASNTRNSPVVKSLGLKKHFLNRQTLAERINNKLLGLADIALENETV